LGALTVLNLGRSFGVLIAKRKIKTRGLYGFVRHPMYATDILLRVGYIVSHASATNIGIVIASTACYVYRAVQEEKFLSQWPEYREYMARVKHRFIPGVF
jgi:protein-S-isoprenylcysteine O-methyltransferase Ste14